MRSATLPNLADITTLDSDGRSCAYCQEGSGCLSENMDDSIYSYTCCSCTELSISSYDVPSHCTRCLRQIFIQRAYRQIFCAVCGPSKKYSCLCVGIYDTRNLQSNLKYQFYCSKEHAALAQSQEKKQVRVCYYEESRGLTLIESNTYNYDTLPQDSPYSKLEKHEKYERYLLYSLRDTLRRAYPVNLTLAQYFNDNPQGHDILFVLKPALEASNQRRFTEWLKRFSNISYPNRTFFTQESTISVEYDGIIFYSHTRDYDKALWGQNALSLGCDGIVFYSKHKAKLEGVSSSLLYEQATRLLEPVAPAGVGEPKKKYNPLIPPNNKFTQRATPKKMQAKKRMAAPSKAKRKGSSALRGAQDKVGDLNSRILGVHETNGKLDQRLDLFYFSTAKIFYDLVIRADCKKKTGGKEFEYQKGQLEDVGELYQYLADMVYAKQFKGYITEWGLTPATVKFSQSILKTAIGYLLYHLRITSIVDFEAACKPQFIRKAYLQIIDRWILTLTSSHYTHNIAKDLDETRKKQKRQAGKIIITDHPQYVREIEKPPMIEVEEEEKEEEEEEEENTYSSEEEEEEKPKSKNKYINPVWKRHMKRQAMIRIGEVQQRLARLRAQNELAEEEERLLEVERGKRQKIEAEQAEELRVSRNIEEEAQAARKAQREQQRLLRESQTQDIHFNELDMSIPTDMDIDMELNLDDLR